MDKFIDDVCKEFARMGFTFSPLTHDQIGNLYKAGVKVEDVYGLGCDVAAGFDLVYPSDLGEL